VNFSGKLPALLAAIGSLALLAGCSQSSNGLNGAGTSSALAKAIPSGSGQSTRGKRYRASPRERECLARAMFFESNRSSRDGLVAVGSVVMNRLDTGKWGNDICSVVGARRQFAPGVLSRPMNSKALPDVMDAADAVLAGERHGKVKQEVMFFHTAGLRFPYKNMHYTVVAGGNQFYEKRSRRMKQKDLPAIEPVLAPEVMIAAAPQGTAEGVPGVSTALAGSTPSTRQAPILMASAAPMTSGRSGPVVQRRTSRDGGAPVGRSTARDGGAPVAVPAGSSETLVASAEPMPDIGQPSADRFGAAQAQLPQQAPIPAPLSAPAMASAEMESGFDAPEPVMAFGASDEQASEIGQLLVSQQFGQ